MNHIFGEASLKQLSTLHPDLRLIMTEAIKRCEVDFALVEGYRSPEKQFEYFKKGRALDQHGNWVVVNKRNVITNIDGYKIIGKHNYYPSIAVDIAAYVPDKPDLAYDPSHLSYIAGSIMRIAEQLYDEGKITHLVRWGGDWNVNGDFTDSNLCDKPHFEIYITK
jgi:peptidoglycan L-alanyl-D-glutamate endopeptidase CwlK